MSTGNPVAVSRNRWILGAVSVALFCVQLDYFAMNLALIADSIGVMWVAIEIATRIGSKRSTSVIRTRIPRHRLFAWTLDLGVTSVFSNVTP